MRLILWMILTSGLGAAPLQDMIRELKFLVLLEDADSQEKAQALLGMQAAYYSSSEGALALDENYIYHNQKFYPNQVGTRVRVRLSGKTQFRLKSKTGIQTERGLLGSGATHQAQAPGSSSLSGELPVSRLRIVKNPNTAQEISFSETRIPLNRMMVHVRVQYGEPVLGPVRLKARLGQDEVLGYSFGRVSDTHEVFGLALAFPTGVNGLVDLVLEEVEGETLRRAEVRNQFVFDDTAPEIRRLNAGEPADFQARPAFGTTLPRAGFPREIRIFAEDYAPSSGAEVSGVDFSRIGQSGGGEIRLYDPNGKRIPGMMAAQPPSLLLLLPDVYDTGAGIFPDKDQDGVADPLAGSYRVEVEILDRAGNLGRHTAFFGLDDEPVPSAGLRFELNANLKPIPFGEKTYVRKLQEVSIQGTSDVNWQKSSLELQSRLHGPGTIPDVVPGDLIRKEGGLVYRLREPIESGADGVYLIAANLVDMAGNPSEHVQQILLDTVPPVVGMTFPAMNETVPVTGPLRFIEMSMQEETKPCKEDDVSGVVQSRARLQLNFRGKDGTLSQKVPGLFYWHEPEEAGKPHRMLLEFVDENAQVVALPQDGSGDGLYEASFYFEDAAQNSREGNFSFEYSSETSSLRMLQFQVN